VSRYEAHFPLTKPCPTVENNRMSEQAILEGHVSIEAAMRAKSREIQSILVQADKQTRGIAQIERIARSTGVAVQRVAQEEIDAHVSGQSHGGIIAFVGPRRFATLDELVQNSKIDGQIPLLVMLDGIEDPFNFGYAMRALYAAGVDGLIVRPRNWMSAAATVARASAGASEHMPTAIAESVEAAADALREHGFAIACTDTKQTSSIYETDLSGPLFLVLGGEKRGITRSFLAQADLVLEIPYGRRFDQSLGTAAATAVIAFEVMRQRGR